MIRAGKSEGARAEYVGAARLLVENELGHRGGANGDISDMSDSRD
jgi:hypothetical protein